VEPFWFTSAVARFGRWVPRTGIPTRRLRHSQERRRRRDSALISVELSEIGIDFIRRILSTAATLIVAQKLEIAGVRLDEEYLCPGAARTHAQTDGQPENIMHSALSIGQAAETKQRNLRVYVPDNTILIRTNQGCTYAVL